jgi:hypothetical protein
MKTNNSATPSTSKVRREALGSKRPEGRRLQGQGRRVRRAQVGRLRRGKPDPRVTGVGGLVDFNRFSQSLGLGAELRRGFGHVKSGARVVYPMHTQLQLLLDLAVVGGERIFRLETFAADPLFKHLAGGFVPSIDTLYDDLRRLGPAELEGLEKLASVHGLAPVRAAKFERLTIDIDTTVTPVFGFQEGALPGPNPRYHGRPSYHPILARVAETQTLLGARLRPGNRGFGELDVEDVEQWLDRVREASGPNTILTVRIDAAGDCADILAAIQRKKAYFLVKAKQGSGLISSVKFAPKWRVLDRDAFGRPCREMAIVDFVRDSWPDDLAASTRVIAIRDNDRRSGRQVCLWDDLDHSVQVYLTNDLDQDPAVLAASYDGRAGIETLISDLKSDFGIGKVSTSSFDANEALFLIRVLAYNLVRRWIQASSSMIRSWRMSWIREAYILIPGRLLRAGGSLELRLAPRPALE